VVGELTWAVRDRDGAVVEGGVIALSPEFPQWPTLRSVIAAGRLGELEQAARGQGVTHPDGVFRWDIPVPDPEKILCVGVNFPERNAEYKDGSAQPEYMSLFPRFPRSFTGHGGALVRPPESDRLDYEGEIAIVIGKGGRRIAQSAALDHIAGYACYNEGSVRDWQRHSGQYIPGKNFEKTGSFGPWMVTPDDIPDVNDLTLVTRLNGEEMQRANSSELTFPIPEIIAYCSTFTELVPGDVIVTGTPGGVGSRREPPVFMKPGDVVEVEVSSIGVLRNKVERD
jgi:2-keto-4-pentenoate hydratase/2-oxohepta-3-ene-1,7-dioic acid hydratase in catechol pathway